MNILAVGAHYDDLELGCGGSLINHVHAGDRVVMLVLTHSAYSDPDGRVVRDRATAEAEGRKAADLIGAKLHCLGLNTLEVPCDESLTKQLQKYVEDYDINCIYSHWDNDLHRDHRHAALCTMMAGRHVPRFLMYRSNVYETGHPFVANVFSDISAVMERKLDVIRSHQSELQRCRESWLAFVRHANALAGQGIGVAYAEAFSSVRYLMESRRPASPA